MMGRLFFSLLVATVLAAGPVAGQASPAQSTSGEPLFAQQVLGRDGTIYRLIDATYGELFTGAHEAPADSRVLALEIITPEGNVTRKLVPETSSRSAELAPQMVYVQSSNTVFLLWEGIFHHLHPLLYLASFQNGEWIDVLEITGDPFARKGQPQLTVTRDLNRTAEETRTTLHTVWWEETSGGTLKRYAPIVIENGVRRTWHPTWDLSSFVSEIEGAGIRDQSQVVRVGPGPRHNSVVIGFMTTPGDRVVTLEAEVLPSALGDLGDAIRTHLETEGQRATSLEALADSLADFIRDHGEGFHEASLDYLAESSREALLETRLILVGPFTDLTELSDQARIHIINEGVRIATHGLEDDAPFEIIEIERPDQPGRFHLLKVSTLSERPAPLGVGAQAELHLSVDGRNAVLAWQHGSNLVYVESIDEGWGPERRLALGESFDLATARAMLETLAASR